MGFRSECFPWATGSTSVFCLEHELKQSTSPNWFHLQQRTMCLRIFAYLAFRRPSLPLFTTHPWNEKRSRSATGYPQRNVLPPSRPKPSWAVASSHGPNGICIAGGTRAPRRVWKNPIKISGETKTSPYKKKHEKLCRKHIFFQKSATWICFYVFLFQTIIDSPPKKNSKKTTRTKTLNPWPPGHKRCEEQESHFHGPIFGCLGPMCQEISGDSEGDPPKKNQTLQAKLMKCQ